MRVSMVTFDFGESVIPLASELTRHASVQLVIPRRELEPFQEDLDDAVRVVAFHKPRLRQAVRQMATLERILRQVRRFRPDVIHLQQGHLWFNAVLRALGDTPLVVTVHDPLPHPGDRGGHKTPPAVAGLAYRRADRVIAHAQHVRRTMVQRWGLPPDGIDVIPLAFGWRPSAADLPQQRSRLLFFGRIWPYKGLDHLIAAEPLVSARLPDLEIVIAGGGEDFGRYRRMMVHPDRFRVEYGYLPVPRREQLFDEAAAVVLPYVEATQSGVVPLAYRHGKPVIATTVGGLPEVVQDGRTGRLVPPGDPRALAAAIVEVLGDRQRRAAMSAQARQEFESTYHPARLAAQTLRAYERALERCIHPRRTSGLTAVDSPAGTRSRHSWRSP